MPKVPRSVLKSFFETGDRPTQADFGSLIDSMLHYSEDQNRLGLRTYDPLGSYVVGDTVIYNGNIYQCTAATTGTFDSLKWNPMVQLGSVTYMGSWNANTNTPLIKDNVGLKGSYYVVSDAGTTSINGQKDWSPGDWIIFNGSKWEKVDNSSEPLNAIDVTFSPTGDITSLNVQAAIAELADDLVNGLANKASKVTGATLGNFAALNSSGNLTDSNFSPDDYLHKTNTNVYVPTDDYNPATKKYVDVLGANINQVIADKLDVIKPAKDGHVIMMDANGRLLDSGYRASDFLNSIHTALDIPFASPSGEIQAVNVQDAIIEVYNDISSGTTNKANKVVGGVAGNIVTLAPDGDIRDSGLKTTSFLSSATTAINIPFVPGSGISSTNVQTAIQELRTQIVSTGSSGMPLVPGAVAGNFAYFDASGKVVDSGTKPLQFMLSTTDAAGIRFTPNGDISSNTIQNAIVELRDDTNVKLAAKMNQIAPGTSGNLAGFDSAGVLSDSGYKGSSFLPATTTATNIPYTPGGGVNSTNVQSAIQELRTQITSASAGMPLVPTAVSGNLPVFDATGKVIDSGTKSSNFMPSNTDASGIRFTPNGDISSNTVQSAIVELRDDTNVKLAAKMNQITPGTSGNLAGFDSAGVLSDSGYKGSSFLPATTTATNIPYTPGSGINSTNVQAAIQELKTQISSGSSGMPLVPTAVSGNLPVFDATGKVIDSGTKSSNFMPSNTDASGIRFTPNGDIAAITVQNAIVEVRDDTNTKLTSKYNTVSGAVTNNVVLFSTTGTLKDSGRSLSEYTLLTDFNNSQNTISGLQGQLAELQNQVLFLRRSVIPFVFPFNYSSANTANSTAFNRIPIQVNVPDAGLSFPGSTGIIAQLVIIYSTPKGVGMDAEAALSDFTNAISGTPEPMIDSNFKLPATNGVFSSASGPEFRLPPGTNTYTVIYRKVTAVTGSVTVQSATLILRYQ